MNETPKQDIIEFICGSGTYDGYQWQEATRDKRPRFWWRTKLLEYVTGLRSRVSELEVENKELKDAAARYQFAANILLDDDKEAAMANEMNKLMMEKERLEKEVETLRETMNKLMASYGKGEPDPKCDC